MLLCAVSLSCSQVPVADHPDDPPECKTAELGKLAQEYTLDLLQHCGRFESLEECPHFELIQQEYEPRFQGWAECNPAKMLEGR